MKKLATFALAVLILTSMVGCAGSMDGVIRRDAARIQITYTDTRVATAELITVLPGGEQFRGKSEKLDMQQELMAAGAADRSNNQARFPAVQTFPGNAKALLSDKKGGKMACRFKLTDIIIGFSSGGVGLCQMSDGRVIDVFF
ncbi:MAG: hypothetical protein P8X90_14655 [Desulfobacterales bacterium]|jgi:hypothetical protein